jgi:hypothetical protein
MPVSVNEFSIAIPFYTKLFMTYSPKWFFIGFYSVFSQLSLLCINNNVRGTLAQCQCSRTEDE